jgi:hypothetical protein
MMATGYSEDEARRVLILGAGDVPPGTICWPAFRPGAGRVGGPGGPCGGRGLAPGC